MRLLIRAVSLAGQPLTQPITGVFDDRGGTIGRAETCTLMLPDPERHISRVQAEVSQDARGYAVRNVSHANPIVVNGRPVPSGRSVLLSDGDDLQIGSYLLRVSRTSQVTAAPMAPAPAPAPMPVAAPAVPPPAAAAAFDPFDSAAWSAPGASVPSGRPGPFDGLGGFEPAAPPPAPVLPSGFDLGTDLGLDPGGAFGASRALPSAGLDDLFGLGPAVKGTDAVDDFLRAAPVQAAPAAVGQASDVDLLAMFSATPASRAAPVASAPMAGLPAADRTPELHGSLALPVPATSPEPTPVPAPRGGLPPGSGLTQILGDVRNWGLSPSAPVPVPVPVAEVPVTAAPAPVPAPAPATNPPEADPLWAAFCEGAGIGLSPPGGLNPALMRVIGQMLRRSVDGTVQLVAARATTKAELHAQVTMIQPRNNNPLKFSPDGRMALEQLLQPPLRGFLGGPEAIDQAMDDLVGHAVGTMAGMRAALDGVLARFAPDQLEAKLTRQSVLDSVLPMHRRARLWELYLQHFQSVRDDAKDDFHSLFGKAFLQAYEEQLDRLDASRHAAEPPAGRTADGGPR